MFVDRCALADETVPHGRAAAASTWATPGHVDAVATTSTACTRSPIPEAEEAENLLGGRVIIEMRDVSKTFHQRGHDVPALVGIRLGVGDGETVGLVGESGSGKTTLAKVMLGIYEPDPGSEILLDEHLLAGSG